MHRALIHTTLNTIANMALSTTYPSDGHSTTKYVIPPRIFHLPSGGHTPCTRTRTHPACHDALQRLLLSRQAGVEEKNRKKKAEELLGIISGLGPAIIKAGQALSSRPDLLPKEYLDELQKLQVKQFVGTARKPPCVIAAHLCGNPNIIGVGLQGCS